MVIQRCFFLTPHFWPFKNHWTCQKSCFLIRRGLKKPFFLSDLPQGVLFCQIRVSCQTFKMVIQRCFFLTPHFWPFKNHWTCQKSCFLIRRGLKKPFFYLTSPQGVLFCQIRVSCQTFKMVIQRCFFLTPHFWPFKNHWTCQKSCFLIRRGLKKPFFLSDLPQGVLFCQIRVSCQTFKMVIQRCFFLTPHFWPFKNHWTCQKSCFLIRRGLKKPFFLSDLPPGGLVLPNKSQLSNLQNGHTEMLFF